MNTLSSLLANLRKRMPVGSVQMYAGTVIPSDWLLCDGSAVSRTQYPALFNAIGTSYGEGDGSTTFNLPDMQGRMPIGVDNTYPITGTGSSGGAASVSYTPESSNGKVGNTTLKVAQIPSHTHGSKTLTGAVTAWGDTGLIGASATPSGIISKGTAFANGPEATSSYGKGYQLKITATHTHASVGGDDPHTHTFTGKAATINTIPPYRSINFIIYAGK